MIHLEPSVILFVLFSFSLMILFVLLPIWYSVRQRSLEGVVSDQDGRPLSGAKVTLKNILSSEVRPCMTDRLGRFNFKGLSAMADYEIAVEHDQHLSEPITLWQPESHCELHLQLEPMRSEEVKEISLTVLHDGIDDPHWFGVS